MVLVQGCTKKNLCMVEGFPLNIEKHSLRKKCGPACYYNVTFQLELKSKLLCKI